MSVEDLLGRSGGEFVDHERASIEKDNVPRSPIYIVGSAYISQASSEIKEIYRRHRGIGRTARSHEDFVRHLPNDHRRVMGINIAGFVFGVSLHVIEEALVDRVVVARNIEAEFDKMALGTPFSLEAGYIIAGEEQISEEKWRGMIDCVSEDPTFSTFFGKKFDALPDKVKHMMRNPGMRGWIEETIVPVYKRQTDKLISDRAKS